ncbi:MAG: TIGR04063 family PEP-CTERM/XrtA system glycosyltransferase [Pseudomonadota bacterium]
MRILHVFDHSLPIHSGYSFRSLAILREERRRGWQTIHLTSPKHYAQGPACEEVEGFSFHRSPPLGEWVKGKPLIDPLAHIAATTSALLPLARAGKPDLIHAHSPVLNALAAYRVARRLRIPWIYEVRAFWEDAAAAHGGPAQGSLRYRLSQALETWALRRADGVTAICQGLLDDIARRGVPAARMQMIPNAVDAIQFTPPAHDAALAQALGLEGRLVLGFLGSFYDYEGLDILLAAVPRIAAARPEVALLLVGGGPREEALKTQAQALGLGPRVRFAGRVPQADVGRYYGLADMLVFPRKSMRLTELVTPLKPLEAMAQRKLVLASDVGGHRELIADGKTGVLFKADDPAALADAVLGLAASSSAWPAMLDAAQHYVGKERTWASSVAGYEALIARLGASTPMAWSAAK